MAMITTAQIRGARGLLNWSQLDLAERADVSSTSIGSIENSLSLPRETTIHAIQKALEAAGIEFLPNDGVRRRAGNIRVFQGRFAFWEFYEDIYETLSRAPGEVVVNNVDEREFERHLGAEKVAVHVARMQKIEGLHYKILIREGDGYYLATPNYAEYRWLPSEFFTSVPFYVYGDKLGILLFDAEPTVIVLEYPMVAAAYRKQFDAIWRIARLPGGKEGDA